MAVAEVARLAARDDGEEFGHNADGDLLRAFGVEVETDGGEEVRVEGGG